MLTLIAAGVTALNNGMTDPIVAPNSRWESDMSGTLGMNERHLRGREGVVSCTVFPELMSN